METTMSLRAKHCRPCEGGVVPLTPADLKPYLENLPGWELSGDGKLLSRSFVMKNFMAGIDLVNKIASLAEEESHHPDIHITGYRNLRIELWTHAIGGVSMNDVILAAKIDGLPKAVKV